MQKIKVIPCFILMAGVLGMSFYKNVKKIQINAHEWIVLEVAKTQSEKLYGLMYRKKLAANQGMLFIYDRPQIYGIWMKNTLIPLDIIWLDTHKKVVYYLDHVPICRDKICPIYYPPNDLNTQYIIELNSGTRQRLNIQKGQALNF
jgi:uncharacterized protein